MGEIEAADLISLLKKAESFRNHWLHVGMNAGPVDRKRIAGLVQTIYRRCELKDPEILWFNSPKEAAGISVECPDYPESPASQDPGPDQPLFGFLNDKADEAWKSVYAWGEQVRVHGTKGSGQELVASIEDQIPIALHILCDHSGFWMIEREINRDNHVGLCEDRSALIGGLAYPGFFAEQFGVAFKFDLRPLIDLCESCGWWIPMAGRVLISENPQQVHLKPVNGIPVLHRDGGAAIRYADGFCVYALNGVPVTEEIAVAPGEVLNPRLLIGEEDEGVQGEIVRKIGMERVCRSLGAKIVDHKGDYELLVLDIGDGRKRPYLKMKNPSIGIYHVEGVPPEIDTVEEALAWRNGTLEVPLTIS